ncbi:MAG: tRNA1(Val) (adenine(37)-N6)-methyltransferase [Lachnospiraceae bacterium]|nr:tRNA1(Val) (adenine(37)-N6)-methyltransferase [Lachnospiraceae bacterium]
MTLRLDDLQNGYHLWQDPEGFCFGIDAVLLAHYTQLRKHDRVLDMGCGNGIIPVLLTRYAPEDVHVTGLEIQDGAFALAQKNVVHNKLEDRITIRQGDLKTAGTTFGDGAFHVVTCNPPYWKKGSGYVSDGSALAIARHEILCDLEDVITSAAKVLKSKGRFFMIHSPERIPEMIRHMAKCHLEMKTMRLIHPYADKAPTMVLIGAVKGGNPGLKVEKPLVVYEPDGTYTPEVLAIYGKDGQNEKN